MKSRFSSLVDGLRVVNGRIVDYDDWRVFERRLIDLIDKRRARRIPTLRTLYMPDEEWYMDTSSGEIYVYVKPDDKIMPRWSPVDVFAPPKQRKSTKTGLEAIPVRRMNELQAASLREFLNLLVEQGMAKVIDPPAGTVPMAAGGKETWYRDLQSNLEYRLIVDSSAGNCRWEPAPKERSSGLIPQ